MEPTTSPAEQLTGMTLNGGWTVGPRIEKSADATGGRNSVAYIVTGPDGRKGFLKAIDLASASRYYDPPNVMKDMLAAYVHERDICQECRSRKMRRVASAVAHGQAQVTQGFGGSVPYIIFDLAESDVRHALDALYILDVAWALRTLHHVATGLRQLHLSGIAHLDMKPSNAICYAGEGTKVSDLGSAIRRGGSAPHEDNPIAGDRNYAPPELLYGYVPPDWNERRLACDLYLLGSLAVYLFARVSMFSLLSSEMDGTFHWRQWRGSYDDVLPYLREGFNRAIATFGIAVAEEFREPVVEIVRQLCDPDPRQRGHPVSLSQARLNSSISRYSLERYVSSLNTLAARAEMEL
jgi:eukaryotic-like serine/threonine-protein kinase